MGLEFHDPIALLQSLRALPRETDWLEFKVNSFDPESAGQYVSGLANSAMLIGQKHAYMIWGIEDATHQIVGTTVRLAAEKKLNKSGFGPGRRPSRPRKINLNSWQR